MITIPIHKIDLTDRRFSISYPLKDGFLVSSIKAMGIIQHVIVLDEGPYVIVTGFKRVMIAAELGLEYVPAYIIKREAKAALLMAIHDNVKRGLNLVEKSYAITKMVEMGFARQEILDTLAIFSMNPHETMVERLMAISQSEDLFKDFIIKKTLSMKNIESLLAFDTKERESIIKAFSSMHTTEAYIRDVLKMLRIIKIRKGSIDKDLWFKGYDGDPVALRTVLKREINPILSSMEEALREVIKGCSIPPGIMIKVDPFFEKEYIDIILNVKDNDETLRALRKIEDIIERGYLERIFELTRGRNS